jgi:hypothetical protein
MQKTTERTERLKRELDGVFKTMHAELDRAELLATALNAFCRPVPDYEPRFRHLTRSGREFGGYELGQDD